MVVKLFYEAAGGRIVRVETGETVVTVEVENLTTDEAARAMAAVLTALESAFPRPATTDKKTD